jgi:hypothetical protein
MSFFTTEDAQHSRFPKVFGCCNSNDLCFPELLDFSCTKQQKKDERSLEKRGMKFRFSDSPTVDMQNDDDTIDYFTVDDHQGEYKNESPSYSQLNRGAHNFLRNRQASAEDDEFKQQNSSFLEVEDSDEEERAREWIQRTIESPSRVKQQQSSSFDQPEFPPYDPDQGRFPDHRQFSEQGRFPEQRRTGLRRDLNQDLNQEQGTTNEEESDSDEKAFRYWKELDKKVDQQKKELQHKHQQENLEILQEKQEQDNLLQQRLSQAFGEPAQYLKSPFGISITTDGSENLHQQTCLELSQRQETEQKQHELEILQSAIKKRIATAGPSPRKPPTNVEHIPPLPSEVLDVPPTPHHPVAPECLDGSFGRNSMKPNQRQAGIVCKVETPSVDDIDPVKEQRLKEEKRLRQEWKASRLKQLERRSSSNSYDKEDCAELGKLADKMNASDSSNNSLSISSATPARGDHDEGHPKKKSYLKRTLSVSSPSEAPTATTAGETTDSLVESKAVSSLTSPETPEPASTTVRSHPHRSINKIRLPSFLEHEVTNHKQEQKTMEKTWQKKKRQSLEQRWQQQQQSQEVSIAKTTPPSKIWTKKKTMTVTVTPSPPSKPTLVRSKQESVIDVSSSSLRREVYTPKRPLTPPYVSLNTTTHTSKVLNPPSSSVKRKSRTPRLTKIPKPTTRGTKQWAAEQKTVTPTKPPIVPVKQHPVIVPPPKTKKMSVAGFWEQKKEQNLSKQKRAEKEEQWKQQASGEERSLSRIEAKRKELAEKRKNFEALKGQAQKRLEQEMGLPNVDLLMTSQRPKAPNTKQLASKFEKLQQSTRRPKSNNPTVVLNVKKYYGGRQMAKMKQKELDRRNIEYLAEVVGSSQCSTAWPDLVSDHNKPRPQPLLPEEEADRSDQSVPNHHLGDTANHRTQKIRAAWKRRAWKAMDNMSETTPSQSKSTHEAKFGSAATILVQAKTHDETTTTSTRMCLV